MNKQGPNGIPWCDYTWSPIVGCSPASTGCFNCYAADISRRFRLPWGGPHFRPDRLSEPAKVRKPSRIFVCSMADLFHPAVKVEWKHKIFTAMNNAPQHIFQLLTKRPENVTSFWMPPAANVWLGVTGETQLLADRRWAILSLSIPAAVRFLSVEPMLEPISMRHWATAPDWIIAGPETGPGARRCDDAWIDALAAETKCFFDKRQSWTRREFPR